MDNNTVSGKKAVPGRDDSIDIIKGIAILLVIYIHTYPFCDSFLRLFSLQAFLICSGYCFKDNVSSFGDWCSYMKRKLKTLYIPCAVYNGLFALLGGVFLRLGLYTDNPEFLEMTKDWPIPQKLQVINGASDILRKFFRVILLTDTTQMGTGTWFLISLFFILAIHGAVGILSSKFDRRYRLMIRIAVLVIMAAALQFIIPTFGSWWLFKSFVYCFFTYLLGVCLRDIDFERFNNLPCLIVCFLVLLVISPFYYIDLANAMVDNILIYTVGVLAGWIMLRIVSVKIVKQDGLTRFFCHIGKNTIPIICLHILCFKLVTWIFIRMNDLPHIYMASFHVDFDAPWPWKLLYLLIGVVIPLMLAPLWKTMIKRLQRFRKG